MDAHQNFRADVVREAGLVMMVDTLANQVRRNSWWEMP